MARLGLRRGRWARAAVAGAVVAGSLLPALPAEAATTSPCPTRTVKRYLTQFDDPNLYFIMPGGTFEVAATDWDLSLAAYVGRGNEPWKVVGGDAARSLVLPGGASATSPTVCIATREDSMRFFYRSPGVWLSRLHVQIEVKSQLGRAQLDLDLNGTAGGWQLTDRILLPDLRDANGKQQLTVTLAPAGLPATWLVDDVLVDPWKTR